MKLIEYEVAKQWHPCKNGNLKPEDFTYKSNKKVWWKCPSAEDHEWYSRIADRVVGDGCPCCSGRKVVFSNCLATTHPEIAKQWHPAKNGNLKPEEIVAGSHKKVWWKCPVAEDHEWEARVVGRLLGYNCPCCAKQKIVTSNCLVATHPKMAAQWHPAKNGNLKPEEIVAGSHKKVWWKCPVAEDHEWATSPNARTNTQSDCPCCVGRKVVSSNCLATTHPEIAKQWHPIKNGLLTPYNVTAGSGKKIWWQCAVDNNEWQSTVSDRKKGSGCPACNESRGESAVVRTLTKNKVFFKREFRFNSCRHKKPLPFDFVIYFGDLIKIIEYQGIQHYMAKGFGSPQPQRDFLEINRRDKIKREWCHKMKIPLLEIPYWDLENIDNIVCSFISQK